MNTRIDELLSRLEQAGSTISPEELCKDSPELLDELRRRAAQLKSVDRFFRASDSDSDSSASSSPCEPHRPSIEGYTILEYLNEGGMGTVWRAVQAGTGRQVALKVLRAWNLGSRRAQERFLRETELAARLTHPNVARVYDGGIANGVCFYAMELIDGMPIDRFVSQHRLPRRQIIELIRTVCLAVHAAHQRLIIHRDLKPSNILVDPNGQPHIVDFGLAKDLESNASGSVTMEGTVPGTPEFMSPEQAAGESDRVDTRSDVYSLGVILYKLLLGALPHESGGSSLKIMRRIAELDARPPRSCDPTIDRDLEAVMLCALERDPERRYGSAAEFANDLDNYLTQRPVRARPRRMIYVAGKWLRRNRYRVIVAGAVTVLMLSLAGWAYVNITQQRNRAELQARTTDAVLTFILEKIFRGADPYVARGREPTARELLERGAAEVRSALRDEPIVQAAVRRTIGRVYLHLGLYEQAVPHIQEALALYRQHVGDEDPQTLSAAVDLGFAYEGAWRFGDAERILIPTLASLRRIVGDDHPDTLEAMHRLANVHLNLNEMDTAEPLLLDALARRRRVLGESHPDTIWSMSDLGALYSYQKRFAQAEPLVRRSYELRRQIDPDGFDVLNSELSLATVLLRTDRIEEAEQLLWQNVEGRTRVLGADHPDLSLPLHRLGHLRMRENNLPEAEALFRRAYELRARVDPREPTTLECFISLIRSIEAQPQRHAETDELRAQLETMAEGMLASPALINPNWLQIYALELDRLGQRERARWLLQKALERSEAMHDADEVAPRLLRRTLQALEGPSGQH